jgi:hypothetical protein
MKPCLPKLMAAAIVAMMLSAGPDSKAADKLIPLPPSKVVMLDFTNMTFTVEVKGTNLTILVTSQTRFFKDGKYATSRELTEGEMVRGVLKPAAEEQREAVRIFWGKPSWREKP